MIIMLLFAKSISDFVHKHPTVKMLALAFMVMIGTLLVVEAFHVHVPKGYIYFSMAFSLIVEMLNLRLRKKAEPVDLRNDELQH
jgi:predicted tellurium resistance membrane protein TerC